MTLLIVIVVLLLLFGGGGGYWGYRRYGYGGGIGVVALFALVILTLYLLGGAGVLHLR